MPELLNCVKTTNIDANCCFGSCSCKFYRLSLKQTHAHPNPLSLPTSSPEYTERQTVNGHLLRSFFRWLHTICAAERTSATKQGWCIRKNNSRATRYKPLREQNGVTLHILNSFKTNKPRKLACVVTWDHATNTIPFHKQSFIQCAMPNKCNA